jgi:hypothetical protein
MPITTQAPKRDRPSFEQAAAYARTGFFFEFWDFLIHNKKWWIAPIAALLFLVGAMIVMGGGAAAPFIYTLF